MTSSPQKIGFIGLGIMGTPMAMHLIAAGHQLYVHTVGKMPAEIASSSATQCVNARGVAERADIVFVMVPDTPDVAAVLFDETGVASGLTKGKTVVDMSSISPLETKAFAKRINALGCDYLDAPVSNSGRLAAMIREIDPSWTALVVPDPDPILASPGDPVATADAEILDRCGPWFNLARALVEAAAPHAFVLELA